MPEVRAGQVRFHKDKKRTEGTRKAHHTSDSTLRYVTVTQLNKSEGRGLRSARGSSLGSVLAYIRGRANQRGQQPAKGFGCVGVFRVSDFSRLYVFIHISMAHAIYHRKHIWLQQETYLAATGGCRMQNV